MKRVYMIVVLLAGSVLNAMAADGLIRPGLWETTTSMQMSGMPGMDGMQMPSHTSKQCYTQTVSDPKEALPDQDSSCKVTDLKQSGNTVTWKVNCTGKEAMAGEGSVTYSKDAYSGTAHLKTSGAMAMDVTNKFSAKRIGDCTK